MPEPLSRQLLATLGRCERPAHHSPADEELLRELVAMRLVTTRRDVAGRIVWRLTSSGEQALEHGWY